MKGYLLAASSILTLSVVSAPAFAQRTAPAAAAEASDSQALSEIVVTAQRKAENLLSVPLSISAQTGDQLANRGIRDVTSLQFTEPGFLPSDAVGFTQLYVRGIGNGVFGYADPTVPIYIDGVPRLYPTMISTFIDVERIELLKGAQGGLYGRNATGGVLNIITRQPSAEQVRAEARISYGTKQTLTAAVHLNLPLVEDKVALSLSGQRDSQDFYIKGVKNPNRYTAANFPNGGTAFPPQFGIPTSGFTPQQTADFFNSGLTPSGGGNDKDLWSFYAKLLLQPTEDLKIILGADFSRKHDQGGEGGFQTSPAYEQGFLTGFFKNFGITAVFPPGFVQGSDGKFTNASGVAPFNHNIDKGIDAHIVWTLPTFDITSISGYRKQKQTNLVDINDIQVPVILTDSQFIKHFFYQELRAVSSGPGPFHWLAGGTYLHNHVHSDVKTPFLRPLIAGVSTVAVDNVDNYTIYGQLGYDFTERVNLTASGRYIHEKHRTAFVSATPVQFVKLIEKKFIPSATLSYKFEGGGTAYARWARGFKAGGVNTVLPPSVFPTKQGLIFDPEQVDTYEIGVRTPLFDRKVQFTSAIFYNDYKNLQVTTRGTVNNPALIFAIVNAPKARTYGGEASVTWRALKGLTVGVNGGYLHARYIKYQITSTLLEAQNLDHTQMVNAPKFQGSFFADLNTPIDDKFNAVGSLIVSHTSKVLYQNSSLPGVLPDAIGPSYTLVNLRVGVRTADDRYGLSIYANNLFNKGYYVAGSSSQAIATTQQWGNPRIVGVELSLKY